MKIFKKAFVFALVIFCFVSFARAQTAASITTGTFNITGGLPPATTSATWTIGGAGFSAHLLNPDVQVIAPVIKRAGTTVEPFTLTYLPHNTARGNVFSINVQWGNIYHRSDNHTTGTTFNFNFPAHALPKFTPNQNDVFITVPFTLDGNVSAFTGFNSTALVLNRAVSGRGTAHINYIRVPNNVRARRTPHPNVWLAYVLFVFHTPNGND